MIERITTIPPEMAEYAGSLTYTTSSTTFTLPEQPREHNHYFRKCGYDYIDVYRVLELFNVTDPCLQHIIKKALCVGIRGHKDTTRDKQDILDTAKRMMEMIDEQQKST